MNNELLISAKKLYLCLAAFFGIPMFLLFAAVLLTICCNIDSPFFCYEDNIISKRRSLIFSPFIHAPQTSPLSAEIATISRIMLKSSCEHTQPCKTPITVQNYSVSSTSTRTALILINFSGYP